MSKKRLCSKEAYLRERILSKVHGYKERYEHRYRKPLGLYITLRVKTLEDDSGSNW